MDPNYFGMPIPDPHHEKPDADPLKVKKVDPGLIKSKSRSCGGLKMEPWRAVDANNGGVKAQKK